MFPPYVENSEGISFYFQHLLKVFFCRHTLFYRMKKIEELLDVDLSDGHLLFLYELSLKIRDYLSR